jgi:methyltransferase
VRRALALLAFLTAQRSIELVLARRNTRALLARGAYESSAEHYPVMVALHATWLSTLWLLGRKRPAHGGFIAAFGMLQLARLWVLRTLGPRWTTRIIILPGAARITGGPYRFLRHPNYVVVAFELPCVSLALGLRAHAALFGAANLAILAWRIRAEDRAYREASAADASAADCAARS